jgi:histidine triad (HIT) family protein
VKFMADCIFCRIANKEIPSQIVYEDEQCVAFRDLNPQAPVHVLIIPRQHIVNVLASGAEDKTLLGHLQWAACEVARRLNVAESGIRLVVNTNRDGGQTVDHLHLHLLGGRQMTWPPG